MTIKLKFRALLMTLAASLLLTDQVQAAGLRWKFDKVTQGINGKVSHEKIICSVSSEVSAIEDKQEVIYIDYANHVLYRYQKEDGACLKFPLRSSYAQAPTAKELISREITQSLASSMKLLTSADRKKINGQGCTLKNIQFGADLAKSKMVAPLIVNEFNQKFSESMVGYCVSDTIDRLNALKKIARDRSKIYQNNPLLRQLDIVGLVEILNGFPVQINQKVGNIEIITTLRGNLESIENPQQLLPPDPCRK